MQLPLEYDEGHKTNDDKYGAEAQVGKEMAREITWARQGEQDEDRAQPWERAWPPASQVEPQSEVVPARPGAQGQAAGGASAFQAHRSSSVTGTACLLSTQVHRS